MTDEERQEACEALRNGNAHYWKQEWYDELADEIERLAALTQSNAEPVAWQYRWRMNENQPWSGWTFCDRHYSLAHAKTENMEFRSLYTAPPRPDASAGLIEAAAIAEQYANASFSKKEAVCLRGFAAHLRARAAND